MSTEFQERMSYDLNTAFNDKARDQDAEALLRQQIASLIESKSRPAIDAMIEALESQSTILLEQNPDSKSLRGLHLFLSDVSTALKQAGLEDHSVRMRNQSDKVRAVITFASRNPEDTHLVRSASRNILNAIDSMGPDCSEKGLVAQHNLIPIHYELMAILLAGRGLITRTRVDGDVILNRVKEPLREPS